MAKKNNKKIIYIVGGVVVVGALFAWPIITDPQRGSVSEWRQAGLNCLQSHQNLAMHIHPVLGITVDGEREPVPGDLGIAPGCMSEIHTHDESGTLHVESTIPNKEFVLSDFFIVYDKPMVREGFNLEVIADGEPVADPENLVFEDGQVIELVYTSE